MRDFWHRVLVSLEPDYDKYKQMLEEGPKIFADLSQRGRRWYITLQEELLLENYSSDQFDVCVEWTAEQLATWPDVKRSSYDMWSFKRKGDAEKFQTLYSMKWAR